MITFDDVKKIAINSIDDSKNINELIEAVVGKIYLKGMADGNIVQREQEKQIEKLTKERDLLLKEQEAVKPRVSTVEQRCGNCNKVIEMDEWKACPWCGKPILWETVGRSVKYRWDA